MSQGERMLSTPGPGYPCHHSCLSPARPPVGSCADAQGAAQDVPTAPAATACHWQGTSQLPSSLWAFPSPGPAGIISFFQSSPWRQLVPISTTTSPARSPSCQTAATERKKKAERQSQDGFPPLPFCVIPPPWPDLGGVGARQRVPARKAPAASLQHRPALPSPEHPTFEHEASFVSESSPKGVGFPPLF